MSLREESMFVYWDTRVPKGNERSKYSNAGGEWAYYMAYHNWPRELLPAAFPLIARSLRAAAHTRAWILPPLCNSWIVFRNIVYIALHMTIDCYRVGAVPRQ